jgi:hypothetical protein
MVSQPLYVQGILDKYDLARFGRWDTLFAVNYTAFAPTHDSGIKIIQYLKNTKADGFLFRKFEGQDKTMLVAFSDAEFNRDIDSTSTGGHRIRLTTPEIYKYREQNMAKFVLEQANADFLISSKKHKIATDSAPFSEFYQIYLCFKDVMWKRHIVQFIGYEQVEPTIISDSSASMYVITSQGGKRRSQHWHPKPFIPRNAVKLGIIRIVKIGTEHNPPDALTKPLSEVKHNTHLATSGYVRVQNNAHDVKSGK